MMKLAFLSAILMISNSVFAASSYTSCSNGTIDTVGDALFVVNLYADKIEFLPYEGGFTIDNKDVVVLGKTKSINDVSVVYSVEGTEETIVFNAQIDMSADEKNAAVSYSINNEPRGTYLLSCEVVNN